MFFIVLLCTVLFAYLIGSISPSYIAGKVLKGIDLRNYGSGNLGFTNALRVLGKSPGIVVLLLDVFKGFFAVWIGGYFTMRLMVTPDTKVILEVASGMAVILGHVYTCFLGFKGGKGVATGLGVFLFMAPTAVLGAFIVFFVTVIFSRYISLGSILAAVCLPLFIWIQSYFSSCCEFSSSIWIFIFAIVIALFVVYKHIPNIQRLLAGCENKFKWE